MVDRVLIERMRGPNFFMSKALAMNIATSYLQQFVSPTLISMLYFHDIKR